MSSANQNLNTMRGPNAALTPRWNTFKFHELQWQAWYDRARFKVIPAGRGSGKTEMAKRKLVLALMADPMSAPNAHRMYFYGGPTHDQAKRVAWKDFLDLIPSNWIRSPNDISRSELRITTRFGSELRIIGLDKPERIEGNQWSGCVLDESCDLKPKIFDLNLLPALVWQRGWCWRIGVPKRSGSSAIEYREHFDAACRGDLADAKGYTWPSSDIIPADTLAHARATLDPKDYAEQFDAMFQTAGGGIYYCYDDVGCVQQTSYDPQLPLVVGADFNVDPLAWVIGQRRGGTLAWIDEIWLRDATTPDALDVLWQKYGTHKGGFQFFGDASSTSRSTSSAETDYALIFNDDRFRRAGRIIRYPNSNPALKDRFASTNAMFKNADGDCRMHVAPLCVHLRQDLRVRSYKAGTCVADDKGQDVGHMADAMDYAVWMLFPVQFGAEHAGGEIIFSIPEIVR